MRVTVTVTVEAIDRVVATGGRLYVWSVGSFGCQPLRRLEVAIAPPRRRTFDRAEFGPFELYLATDGRWPEVLGLELWRGGVRALWDGGAWAV